MSIKLIRIKKTYEKGFLLADVMLAVFVTVTALVAIMGTMAPLFKDEFFKRDEIIATALAQEGIELVRNVRDNNWKMCTDGTAAPCTDPKVPQSAFGGSFPNSGGANRCTDYLLASQVAPSFPPCNANNRYIVPDSNGLYTVGGSGKFKRTITITDSGAGNVDRDITSTVTWGTGSSLHTVTITDTLTAWGNQ